MQSFVLFIWIWYCAMYITIYLSVYLPEHYADNGKTTTNKWMVKGEISFAVSVIVPMPVCLAEAEAG